MKLNILSLGQCDYKKALDIQYDILKKRQENEIGDTLILVEHPPVITLGRHAQESNIVVSEDYLKEKGVSLYNINRGGDVTYHGLGQIVGYPIVKLKERKIGIKDFVGGIEKTFINILEEEYNIASRQDKDHTGVWVDNSKIVAIGLAVKRGVTMHGFAYNVNTNLSHFDLIVPCGLADKGVTSIEKILGNSADFNNANELVKEYFTKVFDYDGYEEIKYNY